MDQRRRACSVDRCAAVTVEGVLWAYSYVGSTKKAAQLFEKSSLPRVIKLRGAIREAVERPDETRDNEEVHSKGAQNPEKQACLTGRGVGL